MNDFFNLKIEAIFSKLLFTASIDHLIKLLSDEKFVDYPSPNDTTDDLNSQIKEVYSSILPMYIESWNTIKARFLKWKSDDFDEHYFSLHTYLDFKELNELRSCFKTKNE